MLNRYSDSSYKVSLFFALILHLTLVLFLFVKYTHLRSNAVLVSSNNIINATAVNERDFDNQMSKKMVTKESQPQQKTVPQNTAQKQEPSKETVPIKKSGITDQLQSILKKNLLDEQAQELAELKKEKQKYKKKITKQKERQLQKMLQEQISAEQKQLADAQAEAAAEAHGSRLSGEVNKQLALIKQAIDSQWIKPEGIVAGDFCQLLINVAPGGVVLNVQILRSSGNLALDRSAQAAVFKASPLPVPEDNKMFNEFRVLKPMFNPEGMGGF